MVGREYPVAPVDFIGITQDLANIKSGAQSGGFYRAATDKDGYHIVLKTNDTFDLYKVTKTLKAPNGCVSVLGEQDWDTWTIETETLLGNYAFPVNGLIFLEDDVWVDGIINSARLTIAAATFPENAAHYSHITVNKDLLYTNYDGQDILSMIREFQWGCKVKTTFASTAHSLHKTAVWDAIISVPHQATKAAAAPTTHGKKSRCTE